MNDQQKTIARTCLEAVEGGTVNFPQIVGTLLEAGFESYAIDFRRAVATYYLPDGQSVELPTHRVDAPVAPSFNATLMQAAIREAQQQVPGYTYGASAKRPWQQAAPVTSCRFPVAAHSISAALLKPTSSTFRINSIPNR